MLVDTIVFWPVIFAFLGGSFCHYMWRDARGWAVFFLVGGAGLTVWRLASDEVAFAATLWATAAAIISGLVANFDEFMGPPMKESKSQETEQKSPL